MTDSSTHPNSESSNDKEKARGCEEFLHSKIRSANTISFCKFMQDALYHPELGYYASAVNRVGKEGDFFTSVSVGSVFGQILAHRLVKVWHEMGKPSPFDVLEIGANDASLCSDILNKINSIAPEIVMRYHIVEPLAQLTEWQQSKLAASHSESVSHYASIDDLPKLQGVFLSNELFDAFPVEQVKVDQGQWKQLRISSDGDQFHESWQSINPLNTELLTFTESLEATLPDGYRTEFRPGLDVFIHKITQKFSSAMVLAIDYGFPRSHFYHKSRTEGTLQTYFNHQKDDLPLVDPGNKDITAHVDFTQLANTFASNGWKIYDFSPQSRYLTTHAKLWLQQIESNYSSATLPLIKQFQTLSHPGMMGRQFHILEMTKGLTFTTSPCTARPEEVLEM